MIRFFNWFTKITAWPLQFLCFRTKVLYEDRNVQGISIKGPAIIISNHTSVFDYAVYLFVFFFRTIRCQMAEVLFNKQPLGTLLKMLGGIRVNRDSHDFSFLTKSENILKEGGVVLIFPESRIPLKDEKTPLEFKPSAAYLAINSGVDIIPVYTNGSYFKFKRARVIIGKPMKANEYYDSSMGDRENIALLNTKMREKIIELKEEMNEKG